MLSDFFIAGSERYNTFKANVPAPYIRKTFVSTKEKGTLTVTCSGLYRAFVNGKEITRGILAPYLTNPNQVLFYDKYDIDLIVGKNVVAFILGNGLSNSLDYNVWQFETASWRSAPKLAFCVDDGERKTEGHGAKCFPSAIRFDDLHAGEKFDKNYEIKDFSSPDYDDKDWSDVIAVPSPLGEKIYSDVPPIVVEKELSPVKIIPYETGYIYDFGTVSAGNMRLTLHRPTKGQSIKYIHTEVTKKGKPCTDSIVCWNMKTNQTFYYTASGEEVETYEPSFTYIGCRYVYVEGIRPDQATEDLFTFMVMHGQIRERGYFSCSDDVANKIEIFTKNTDKCNLYYFPTDCPQREKNGWTGDASISCEHYLANFDITLQLKNWLRLIVKSQNHKGALPGIVPTDKWGFLWGNGPIWDAVLINIPYEVYRLNGDKEIIDMAKDAILKYFTYTKTKLTPRGLANFGLGDWVQPHCTSSGHYSPRKVTNTLSLIDSALKTEKMFRAVGYANEADFVRAYAEELISSFRKSCFNEKTGKVLGNCQTSQAYAVMCGFLTEEETKKAGEWLLKFIKKDDNTLNGGFIGARVLFHALTKIGQTDLAYKLITQPTFPSYGYMVAQNTGTIWEAFEKVKYNKYGDMVCIHECQSLSQAPYFSKFIRMVLQKWFLFAERCVKVEHHVSSLNHHAFGDVSNYFKQDIGGIYLNEDYSDIHKVDIKPRFVHALLFADSKKENIDGEISVRWKRNADKVRLSLSVPEKSFGKIIAPPGYTFVDGSTEKPTLSGEYTFIQQ